MNIYLARSILNYICDYKTYLNLIHSCRWFYLARYSVQDVRDKFFVYSNGAPTVRLYGGRKMLPHGNNIRYCKRETCDGSYWTGKCVFGTPVDDWFFIHGLGYPEIHVRLSSNGQILKCAYMDLDGVMIDMITLVHGTVYRYIRFDTHRPRLIYDYRLNRYINVVLPNRGPVRKFNKAPKMTATYLTLLQHFNISHPGHLVNFMCRVRHASRSRQFGCMMHTNTDGTVQLRCETQFQQVIGPTIKLNRRGWVVYYEEPGLIVNFTNSGQVFHAEFSDTNHIFVLFFKLNKERQLRISALRYYPSSTNKETQTTNGRDNLYADCSETWDENEIMDILRRHPLPLNQVIQIQSKYALNKTKLFV